MVRLKMQFHCPGRTRLDAEPTGYASGIIESDCHSAWLIAESSCGADCDAGPAGGASFLVAGDILAEGLNFYTAIDQILQALVVMLAVAL